METMLMMNLVDKIDPEAIPEEVEDFGDRETLSISSDDEGTGADCVATSRLKPMRDIWPADEIVIALTRVGGEEAGTLACAGRADELLALPNGSTAGVLWASWLGKPVLLQKLISGGGDVNATDDIGRSALHLAALVGSADCARLLLQQGAESGKWDGARRATPLHCAASAKSLPTVQLLIRHRADVNAGINERSPLHYAVQSDAIDCVQELLQNGARPDTPQVYTETPLHVAAALGSTECIVLLLSKGADARAQLGTARVTALHLAAEDGNLACVRVLLDGGAPIDALNKRHQTPLHLACIAQSQECMEILMKRGANPRARDADGRTPLHAALGRSARGPDMARALLQTVPERPTDLPNLPDNYGYTPLHLAALNEFSSCVSMLLDYGADVTVKTKGGHSALSFIVRRTPEVLPVYISKFDDAVKVVDHEIGDVDCEIKLDFRPLVRAAGSGRGESALLLAFVDVGRRDVLKHPLCETFIYLKWRRIRKFFLASLIYHTLFVLLFSIYTVGVYLRNCPSLRAAFEVDCEVKLYLKLVGYLVLILNFLLVFKEVFQAFHDFWVYIRQWENWLQWLIIICVFMCAVPGEEENIRMDLASWQHHVAAISIFLAWLELMLIVGRFPMFGLYVQMFATVSVNFAKFLMAYSCLLVAFALSFGVLFAYHAPFGGVWVSLLKVIVMMAGELEYEDMFYQDAIVQYPGTSHVLFLAFVLLVTIILANLMVGLAVSDIQALQESAGLDRLVRQAGLVARLEGALFSRLLGWAPLRVLAVLHKGALLLPEPYHWALCIRPNDPRENRIPKELISAIYKLVAERKELCRKSKGNNYCFGETTYEPRSRLSTKDSTPRTRTTSDVSNAKRRTLLLPPPLITNRKDLEQTKTDDTSAKLEKLEDRLAAIEVLLSKLLDKRHKS